MEYLVRVPDDVVLARMQTLRHPGSIYGRAEDIKEPLSYQPVQPNLLARLAESKGHHTVRNGEHSREAQCYKHGCPKRPQCRFAKTGDCRDGCTPGPENHDHAPVQSLQLWRTVKAIVDAGDKAASDQAYYSEVVACVADVSNPRRVV